MIEFFTPAGDPAGPLVFTNLEAGLDSDVLQVEAWHDRGSPGGTARSNVRLVLETEDPGSPGVWLASGVPPQDELWGRYRVTGFDNTAVPAWSVPLTDWRLLGHGRATELAEIPSDCGVALELKMHPPSSAAALSYGWRLAPVYNEHSRPRPPGLEGAGVLHHHGDRRRSYVIRGCDLTATGTPDDQVHVAPGLWLYQGDLAGKVTTDHQLDQLDGAAQALQAGESYLAAIILGGAGVIVPKGLRAAAPVPPAIPAGAFLGLVEVVYQAGGISVIDPSDITGTPGRGRHFAELAGGLGVRVFPGELVAGETLRYHDLAQVLMVADESQLSLWVLSDGLYQIAAAAPEETAEEIWYAETTAGAVTLLEDRRRPAERPVVLELSDLLPGTPGVVASRWWDGPAVDVERLVVRVSDAGAGASSGQTKLDVLVDGASVFDTASEDLRPVFAWDTTDFRRDPELQVPRIPSGALVELVTVEHPTGGAPSSASVSLVEL